MQIFLLLVLLLLPIEKSTAGEVIFQNVDRLIER
jgi:hypothetical protein